MPARKPDPEPKPKAPGRNVEEWERGTVRVRIARSAHARARLIADRSSRDIADVIADAIERMAMPDQPPLTSTFDAARELRNRGPEYDNND